MKKSLLIILCMALVITAAAACTSSGPAPDSTTSAAQTSQAASAEATQEAATEASQAATTQADQAATTQASQATTTQAEAATTQGGENAELETYVIQHLVEPRQFVNNDKTMVSEIIKEKFNIEFELIPYADSLKDKAMLMLAAGDFTDIVWMEREVVSSYIAAGALVDLDQYKDIMPNFWDRYGEVQIPYWRIDCGGPLYKYETGVPLEAETDITVLDMYVRTDVLEKYGWPNPLSASEWVKFLKQAKADFPEINGQPTVGMTCPMAEAWGRGLPGVMYEKGDTYMPLSGAIYNLKEDIFEDAIKNKYWKDGIKYFNDLYQEGLLDEECFTDLYSSTEEKLISGVALSVFYTGWGGYNDVIAEVDPNRQYIMLPIQSDSMVAEGQNRLIMLETTRPFLSYGITTNAKYPERIAALIDWAASDEGQITLSSGIEGVHWVRDASGKRVLTEARMQAAIERAPDWNYADGIGRYSFLPGFNKILADGQYPDLFSEAAVYDELSLTSRQKEAFAAMGWPSSKAWYIDHYAAGYTGLAGSIQIDSTSDYGRIMQQITEMRDKWITTLIIAKDDDEFENLYEQMMAEYERLNPESIVDEYNRLYEEAKKQLGQ